MSRNITAQADLFEEVFPEGHGQVYDALRAQIKRQKKRAAEANNEAERLRKDRDHWFKKFHIMKAQFDLVEARLNKLIAEDA